jgi:hypothetical protein
VIITGSLMILHGADILMARLLAQNLEQTGHP